uniref:transglutaminase family protein n=1 Tax=Marisediminicola senii TaxID=2711233 RepID=UPI001F48DC84
GPPPRPGAGGPQRPRGTSAAVRPERAPGPQAVAWQVSVALLVAITVSAWGLHVLLAGMAWIGAVVVTASIALGAAAGLRTRTRNRVLPPLAGIGALTLAVTAVFGQGTTPLVVIPTFDTIARFVALTQEAQASIYRQAVPAVAEPSIIFVLCLGVGILAVLCDFLAIALRSPALVGIPLVAVLAVPAFTSPGSTDPVVFVLAAVAYLAVLLAGRPQRQPGIAAGIAASAIVGALLVPAVLPEIDDVPDTLPGGVSTGVNPVLGLGDDLRRSRERTALTYETASGEGHYLRLVTLEDFTGDAWQPTDRETDTANDVQRFVAAPGLDDDVPRAEETSSIDVRRLTSTWLPLPYPPTSVNGLDSDWYWDAETFATSAPDDTASGQDYVVESAILQPTPEQLLAAGSSQAPGLEAYLALPDDLPAVIAETGASIAAQSGTDYERAIALQEYLRSSEFRYSESAPVEGDYDGTGMDVIAQFLDVRAGYCTHFAGSMAVMARTLGIPSRVAVGFLPGSPESNADGREYFEVTTHDLHAWPELYFDGIGWIPFEPTPGRGELAAYADVAAEGVPDPPAEDEQVAPTPTPDVAAPEDEAPVDPGALDGDVGSATQEDSTLSRTVLIVLALLGMSLVPALVRASQRWRLVTRLRAGEASAADAWHEVMRTAVDHRVAITHTTTPAQTAAAIGVGGRHLGVLLDAVEREGYAATTLTRPGDLVGDVTAVRRDIAAAASTRVRLLAVVYPASLWRTIAHPLTREE